MTAPPYATSLVRLLKGPVYSDSGDAWEQILRHHASIEDYFGQIGLELVVAEHDGLHVDPRIAKAISEFVVKRRCRGARYEIRVKNGGGAGPARLAVNGAPIVGNRVPYAEPGTHVLVEVDV